MTFVVGYGADPEDLCALELGATLARSAGTDLLVVTVVPAPWPTAVARHSDREFEEWARARGEAAVAEATDALADQAPDVPGRAVWIHGRSVAGALLDHAEEIGASLLVLGSGSDGPYGGIHLCSISHRLLHSSTIPVALAARGYAAGSHQRITRATAAFRGDQASRATLERTAELCAEVGAALRIVTFAIRGGASYAAGVGGGAAEEMVLQRWVEQAAIAQEEAVDQLRGAGILPTEVEQVVARGRSWSSAVDQLEWGRDEVLVLGSSASAGVLSRIFLGSSGSKILRHAPVPTIVVP